MKILSSFPCAGAIIFTDALHSKWTFSAAEKSDLQAVQAALDSKVNINSEEQSAPTRHAGTLPHKRIVQNSMATWLQPHRPRSG